MFSLFKKKSSIYSATLMPSGKEIRVKRGENLLTAALSAGVKWPYKCRVGSCGTCKCKILDGKISPEIDFGYVLNFDELNDGYALACQTALKTDIKVMVNLKK
jgi:CDP-4-dehydro-6-deoxyglucose reductase